MTERIRGAGSPGVSTRRQLLARAGVLGLGLAGLSACGGVSTNTGGNGGSGSAPGKVKKFAYNKIPDPQVKLPTDQVQLTWLDSGDLKALFEKPFFDAYHEKHPNIKVDYQPSSWAVIQESLPVAIRNHKAPDVFALPGTIPTQLAVNNKWIKPIDDIVPDFENWKKLFPTSSFVPGVNVFDGKTYTYPASSSKRLSQLLIFHPPFLEKAGYDPINERMTWDTFRAACKKLTTQGKGKYYGLMIGGTNLSGIAEALAQLGGLHEIGGIDPRTGEYVYSSDLMVAAFELLLAIKDDKSLFPGYMSLDDATARTRFPSKVAGFHFDGPWAIPAYEQNYPDFAFDIAMPPYGNDKEESPMPFNETGANFAFVSAETKNDAIIGDMFHFLGSVAGQTNMVAYSEGNLTSVIDQANAEASKSTKLDPAAKKANGIADRLMRVAPDARVRNPDIAKVVLALKPPTPMLTDIAQAVFTGKAELKKSLQNYNDASNKALDDAIATARKQGAKVSREDYVFSNWDPTKDYSAADYEALK